MNILIDDINNLIARSPTQAIAEAFIKSYSKIHGFNFNGDILNKYKKIMVSISGGSDSDILIDFVEKIGHPKSEVKYVFFDTGMEFDATRRQLEYLENKYNVTIERERAVIPVPLGVKKYGLPFLSKQVSEFISRLQRHGFKWQDKPFDILLTEYPKCKAALRWWCNEWGENSRVNIDKIPYLKEFLILNPPDFPISCGCCNGAKKRTAHAIAKKYSPDLDIQGIRKAEGGARSIAYSNCFDEIHGGCDKLRPIFWLKSDDKREYENAFDIKHSDCYAIYGLPRTGCACCPFASNFENELAAAEKYEPKLYKAACNVFGKSYEYTREYREFKKQQKELSK